MCQDRHHVMHRAHRNCARGPHRRDPGTRGWSFRNRLGLFGHAEDRAEWRAHSRPEPEGNGEAAFSLINDPRTANDPAALANRVNEALAEFLNQQLWEREHPGQLWDTPKR